MLDVSSPTPPTGRAPTKPAKDVRPVDDQSDLLTADTRVRAMSDSRITETMPVELLRDARDIYGIGVVVLILIK